MKQSDLMASVSHYALGPGNSVSIYAMEKHRNHMAKLIERAEAGEIEVEVIDVRPRDD